MRRAGSSAAMVAAGLPIAVATALNLAGLFPHGSWRRGYDLDIYLRAVRAWAAGQNPYSVETADRHLGFTYPPLALIPFRALTAIDTTVLHVVWTLGIAACAVVCLWSLQRTRPTNPPWRLALAATVLAFGDPIYDSMTLGQLSPLIGLLGILAICGDRPPWASLGGLGGALKLTPLGLAVHLPLIRHPLRRLAWMIAGFLVPTTAVALVLPHLSRAYWTDYVLDTTRVGAIGSSSNTSMAGALAHLGVPDKAAEVGGLVLTAVLTLLWLRRHRSATRTTGALPEPIDLAVGAGCLVVLATPLAWSHHALAATAGCALLILGDRVALGVALGLLWILPLFLWAGDVGGIWGVALSLVRPVSLVALVLLFTSTHRATTAIAAETARE
ncbi:MAG: glycosyltransferase 87 family protein [Dermatophilaceae bacterium]